MGEAKARVINDTSRCFLRPHLHAHSWFAFTPTTPYPECFRSVAWAFGTYRELGWTLDPSSSLSQLQTAWTPLEPLLHRSLASSLLGAISARITQS